METPMVRSHEDNLPPIPDALRGAGLVIGGHLRLDLSEGWIAHQWLLRWLGDRLGTPVFRCLAMPDKVRGKWCTALSLVEGGGCGRVLWHLDYPALTTLDPHDDTRLPWGGRAVDSMALVAVVQHLHTQGPERGEEE